MSWSISRIEGLETDSLKYLQESLAVRIASWFHCHRKSQLGKNLLSGPYLNMFYYLHSKYNPRSIRSDGTHLRHSHKCADSHVYQGHIGLELPKKSPGESKLKVEKSFITHI